MPKLRIILLRFVICLFTGILFNLPKNALAISPSGSQDVLGASEKETTYVVKDGDTLWGIAEKYYGSGFSWDTIANKNNIQDPSTMSSGITLTIPSSSNVNNPYGVEEVNIQPNRSLLAYNDSGVSISDAVYADIAVRGYLDNVSIYAFDGNSQDTVVINQDRHWLPASTVKTFVAMYAYNQISKKKLSLNDSILIEAKNVVPTELITNELSTLEEGQYITVDRLLRQMITQSDNTAYNVLLDVLNRQEVTNYIHSLGLTHSSVGSKLNLDTSQEQYEFDAPGYGFNTTTAEEYGKAFILIKDRKIPGAKELFAVLSQQKINNMIPLLLPKDLVIAHKHGDLDPLYHDGGIIVAPTGPYILSIFSNLGDPNVVAHISELVYTKNLGLVGSSIKQKALAENNTSDQPLDPLVLNTTSNIRSTVLGASTIANLDMPAITAADLGIKASDLTLTINTIKLPKVAFPTDSPLHILVPIGQFLRKGFTPWIKVDIDSLTLKLAEAKELKSRGKYQQANTILQDMQIQLNHVAKDKAIVSDPKLQTALQAISETRFSILAEELKTANKKERNQLIKTIAAQARATVLDIEPFIPKAISATNPSQEPLIGEIVKTKDNAVVVRTAGGQQITIPNNQATKIRQRGQVTPINSKLASIPVGTTVALIGSYNKNVFIPSFVLTNLQKQLAAPEPVTVLKVNAKNNTMVVSENGIPIQVNITNQTIIKGKDTEVSLKSIQPGDVIVVHGEKTNPSIKEQEPITTQQPLPISGNNSSKSIPIIEKGQSSGSSQSNQGNNPQTPSTTNSSQSHPSQQSQPATQNSQPAVIQSTTVQVVEKKQDVKSSPQSQPATEEKNKDEKKK